MDASTGPSMTGRVFHVVKPSDQALLLRLFTCPPAPPEAVLDAVTVVWSCVSMTGKFPMPVTTKRRKLCLRVGDVLPTSSSVEAPNLVVGKNSSP